MLPYIILLTLHYSSHMHTYILYSISSTVSLCNTCITSHFKLCHFVYILISFVYTALNTIYCILPMPLCTITHSYIFMYIIFIPLHLCVYGRSCGIVRLDYSLVITALSELEAQAFHYTGINIC